MNMTNLPRLTRRNLLKGTTITTTSLSAVTQAGSQRNQPEEDSEPVPSTDLVDDYLGVTALSYDDPKGELWYRASSDQGDSFDDCVYRIVQAVAVQDGDDASHNNDAEKVIVDAEFELQLTAADSHRLPAFYREFESELKNISNKNSETVSTSQLSIDAYPGIIAHYDETAIEETLDNLNTLWYLQSFPWGLLYWDIIYDPTASVELNVDPHQEWLRDRKHRDWDVPSLATKTHWKEAHQDEESGKGRYRGDISPILSAAPGYNESELEQTDHQLWKTAETEQPAVIALNTYR